MNNNENNPYVNNYDNTYNNKYNNIQIQVFTFNKDKNNNFDFNHLRKENIESFFIFKSSKSQINVQLMK